MPRRPAADPTVPITLRLPKSVMAAWDRAAETKGTTTRKLLEAKLVAAVEATRARS